MQQTNSLERAFTVLTYLLLSQKANHTVNQKATCQKFESALNEVEKAIQFTDNFNEKLQVFNDNIMDIQINLQDSQPEPLKAKPYECGDKTLGKLFCEDNRYSKNLVLIGRCNSTMSQNLYRKLLNGIPCDEKCIDSDTDFFIGTNYLYQIVRDKSFQMLFIYIDNDDMEHSYYIPKFEFDGKKLYIPLLHRSMTDDSLKEVIKHIKFWKVFLRHGIE